MFSASRNSVSSSSDVGKTLNSTGFVMYMDTISTITEIVIFELIRMSSRNDGIGAIIAITMPNTPSGTLISASVSIFDFFVAGAGGRAPCFAPV